MVLRGFVKPKRDCPKSRNYAMSRFSERGKVRFAFCDVCQTDIPVVELRKGAWIFKVHLQRQPPGDSVDG